MSRGRPKNISSAKNRVISVILSETAYRAYRLVSLKKKSRHWINEFVSRKIVSDFYEVDEAVAVNEVVFLQEERDRIIEEYEKKIEIAADNLVKIRRERDEKTKHLNTSYTCEIDKQTDKVI